MNREMRKKERQASEQAVKEMLLRGTEGTLSMHGDDGYPYGLPVNYIYFNDAIYIHTLNQGYKIDALKADRKVCFSIIVRSQIIPELYTARYESIVATGDAEFVENETERKQVMETFVTRFSPGLEEGGAKFIKASLDRTAIIKIRIREIKGRTFRYEKASEKERL